MWGWVERYPVGIWAFAVAVAWVPLLPSGSVVGRWPLIGVGALILLLFTTIRMTAGHWLGLALLAWMAAGFAWTVSGWDTAGELLQWCFVAAAFCLAAEIDDLDQFWIGLGLGVTASVPFALMQEAGLDPVTSLYFHPTGLFLTKNMAADAAVLALLGGAMTRWWLIPGPALMVYMVESRAALLALMVAGFFALWVARPAARKAMCVVGALMLCIGAVAAWGGVFGKINDRVEIWGVVARNVHLLGDGLGSFAIAAPGFEYAHSEFLQYAFELGIGSALLWAVLLLALSSGETRERVVLAGLLALCALWFPLHAPVPAMVGAVCAGSLCAARSRARAARLARRMVGPSGLLDEPSWFVGAMQAPDYIRLRDLRFGGADVPSTRGGGERVSVRQAASLVAGAIRGAL